MVNTQPLQNQESARLISDCNTANNRLFTANLLFGFDT